MDKWLIAEIFLKLAKDKLVDGSELNRLMQICLNEYGKKSLPSLIEAGSKSNMEDKTILDSQESDCEMKNPTHRKDLYLTRDMYGWTKMANGEYALNNDEAYYYKMAIDMAAIGIDFRTIADGLFIMGARSKKGKKINGATWKRLCLSEKSYGCAVLHKREINPEICKKIDTSQSEEIYLENALPPITDKKQWEQMKKMIAVCGDTNGDKTFPNKRTPFHGKIKCRKCGEIYRSFYSPRRTKKNEGDVTVNNVEELMKRTSVAMWRCKGDKDCHNINLNKEKLTAALERTCADSFGTLFSPDKEISESLWMMLDRVSRENPRDINFIKLCSEVNYQKDLMLMKLKNRTITDKLYKEICAEADKKLDRLSNKILEYPMKTSSHLDKEKLSKIKEYLDEEDLIAKYKLNALLNLIDEIVVIGEEKISVRFNSDKLRLTPVMETGIFTLESDCILNVTYHGRRELKERTNQEKRRLLELIKQDGRLSFSKYAKELGESKSVVIARMRELKKRGCIERDSNGELKVLKDWTDEF